MPIPIRRNQPHNLVAINNAAVLVANYEAVGIAVKRNADIGFFRPYRVGQKASIGRTAALVDPVTEAFRFRWIKNVKKLWEYNRHA